MSDPEPVKPRHWVWWILPLLMGILLYLNFSPTKEWDHGPNAPFTARVDSYGWPYEGAAENFRKTKGVRTAANQPFIVSYEFTGESHWRYSPHYITLDAWLAFFALITIAKSLNYVAHRYWPRPQLSLSTLLMLTVVAALFLWINLTYRSAAFRPDLPMNRGFPWPLCGMSHFAEFHYLEFIGNVTLAIFALTTAGYFLEWRIARKSKIEAPPTLPS